MAVRTLGVRGLTRSVSTGQSAEILFVQAGQVCKATKLDQSEFNEGHRQALATMYLTPDRDLVFGVAGWKSCWLGAGEEKAVFLVVDPQERAFAVEILSKASYLEGHLSEGHYLIDMYVPGLSNERWDSQALFGHIFSGRVKAREFIYGDTLAGPGLRTAPVVQPSLCNRLIGGLGKSWAKWVVTPRYWRIHSKYRDAHEANVMIEVLPLNNPQRKSHYLLPIPWLEDDGRLHLRFYRLTPIDVRAR